MIQEHISKDNTLYVTIENEDPVLALQEANGYIAKKRKNWVYKGMIAERKENGNQFIGIILGS